MKPSRDTLSQMSIDQLWDLYRQTEVIGGLFRSLGQEADAVGSAYALDRAKGDILSPLIRNLGSMLVQGATPLEVFRQYMAKAESPTRGRELNIHFNDLERGFLGWQCEELVERESLCNSHESAAVGGLP